MKIKFPFIVFVSLYSQNRGIYIDSDDDFKLSSECKDRKTI